MFLWPVPEMETESRTTLVFSAVYTKILNIMEAVGGVSFKTVDLIGDYYVVTIEDLPSRRIYRGYICLESQKYFSFQRVEFCIIQRWDCKRRKFRPSMSPSETLITFGWSSTVDVGANLKMKRFGCRLFRSLYGLPLVDVSLKPKNWSAPFLWGGEVPLFLNDDDDDLVSHMIKKELDTYARTDDGVLTLAKME